MRGTGADVSPLPRLREPQTPASCAALHRQLRAGSPAIVRVAVVPLLVVVAVLAAAAAADARWLLALVFAGMFAAFLRLYVLMKRRR